MNWKKLLDLQNKLKAPKDQKNNFGGYNYRSAEDILAKAKPLCAELGLVIVLTDTMENVNDRVYVCSTAAIIDTEDGSSYGVQAYAREPLSRKGMDESQITGASSSYARKYALGGLLGLDDSKNDPDYLNNSKDYLESPTKKSREPISPYGHWLAVNGQDQNLIDDLEAKGSKVASVAIYFKTTPDKLTNEQLKKVIEMKEANGKR